MVCIHTLYTASMTDKEVMVTWAPPKTLQNESLTFKCFVNGEQLKKRQCEPCCFLLTSTKYTCIDMHVNIETVCIL